MENPKPSEKHTSKLRNKIAKLEEELALREKRISSLEEAEKRHQFFFDSANDGIILHDLEGNILDVNKSMYERLGYTKQAFLKLKLHDLVSPEYTDEIESRTESLLKKGSAVFESGDTRRDGTIMHVEVNARRLTYQGKQVIQSVVRDINDRKIAEELIENSLKEKTLLNNEISMRSQFNHEIFLYTMEAIENKNTVEEIRDVLTSARNRLRSIDFIQNKFNRNNLSNINIDEIIRSLLKFLHLLYRVESRNLQIISRIGQKHFDILKAGPCIYIINEFLSNSMQHAFPNGLKGEIVIELKPNNKGKNILLMRDNGTGLANDFNINEPGKLGFRIIRFMLDILQGELEIQNNKGMEILIRFK